MVLTCDKEPCQVPAIQAVARLGECKGSWLLSNSDGRCSFTNCFVGTNGDPTNCFKCTNNCDNGCGPATIPLLNTDGNFGLFDFGSACCNHDHCWSSTFGKNQCDANFFDQMSMQCTPLVGLAVVGLYLPLSFFPFLAAPLAACELLATSFFLAVKFPIIAQGAFDDAQRMQKAYETTPVCIAQCPSTQTSGGQGTTVLTIDLLRQSGTFPLTYQMYVIPDQLYIDYEGTRIFDTGGLVSGSGAFDVTYSGTSTIISVTINAPNSGTAWDAFVGCPYL